MKRLARRTFLRGAGGAAVALPLLEAMQPRRANAAVPTTRYLTFFTPGGTEMSGWKPTGTETAFKMGSVLEPLEKHQRQLLLLSGIDLKVTSEGNGHPHSRGMGGLLTGDILPAGPYRTNGGNAGFSVGTSIDQTLGQRLGAGRKFRSLELAVRWPSDGTDGLQVHPWNTLVYSAPGKPVPPATNPRAVFERLFKDLTGDSAAEQKRSKTVLDAIKEEYRLLAMRLGTTDRAKLEAHLTELRELEKSIEAARAQGACTIPSLGAELDQPTAEGSNKGGDGYVDAAKDDAIPRTGKLMMDLMVMAFRCDLTRVGTLQWADSQANNSLPWLGLKDTHHGYQHDRGYQPDAIKKVHRWYSTQFAYLLDKLIEAKEADRALLDDTLIFWGTEISHPNSHGQRDMPFLLAGGAGGRVRGGRWLTFAGRSHNDLLVSILDAFGGEARSYGRAKFCTGPLPGVVG